MANKVAGSLDTNILLQLLLDDVPAQTVAVEKLFRSGATFEVADATIIEMVFVLEKIYELDRELIQENVFGIIRNSQFNSNRRLFETALPFYVSQTKLSIMDCVLLSYSRLNKATPLFSFDKELTKHSSGDTRQPS